MERRHACLLPWLFISVPSLTSTSVQTHKKKVKKNKPKAKASDFYSDIESDDESDTEDLQNWHLNLKAKSEQVAREIEKVQQKRKGETGHKRKRKASHAEDEAGPSLAHDDNEPEDEAEAEEDKEEKSATKKRKIVKAKRSQKGILDNDQLDELSKMMEEEDSTPDQPEASPKVTKTL